MCAGVESQIFGEDEGLLLKLINVSKSVEAGVMQSWKETVFITLLRNEKRAIKDRETPTRHLIWSAADIQSDVSLILEEKVTGKVTLTDGASLGAASLTHDRNVNSSKADSCSVAPG